MTANIMRPLLTRLFTETQLYGTFAFIYFKNVNTNVYARVSLIYTSAYAV